MNGRGEQRKLVVTSSLQVGVTAPAGWTGGLSWWADEPLGDVLAALDGRAGAAAGATGTRYQGDDAMNELSLADLTIGERDVMEHALGINYPGRGAPGWRNVFHADPDQAITWDGLVDKGLAFEVRSLAPSDRTFMVSLKGKSLLGVLS